MTPPLLHHALGHDHHGIALLSRADFDGAIAALNEALRINPKSFRTNFGRAVAWTAKGEFNRAIADYSDAIKTAPKFAVAWGLRGFLFARTGDVQRANADIDEALRLEPADAYVRAARCMTLAAQRQLDKALAECNETIRLKRETGLHGRGLVYHMTGNLDGALADYDEALRTYGKYYWQGYYGRGLIKLRRGDTQGGEADIAAAKALQPRVAEEFAFYGLTPDSAPPQASPASAPASTADTKPAPAAEDCSGAETHWKSAEEIKTLEVYQDHLARFFSCNYAVLARARIEALKR